MPSVKVTMTPLPVHEINVMHEPDGVIRTVPLQNGKGTFSADYECRHLLQWRVSGPPNTRYKIELEPAEGELKMAGAHPIEGKIAAKTTISGGSRYFRIQRSE